MKVVSLVERLERREQAHWDREAQALGFKNYAEVEAAAAEAFDAAWSELERNCNHPDKLPNLAVCERCAESLSV